jgi:hypothetical protein
MAKGLSFPESRSENKVWQYAEIAPALPPSAEACSTCSRRLLTGMDGYLKAYFLERA